MRTRLRRWREWCIERWIFVSGTATIVLVLLIFVFLIKEAFPLIQTYPLSAFLAGRNWYPLAEPPQFGTAPLLLGSLWVTVGAAIISIPIGIGCAVFIAEIAPAWLRGTLKVIVELLAAIPSIVLGFIGLVTLVPLVKHLFHLPTGLTGLAGSIMLAFMAMPTIVTIIDDALRAVPQSYRDASLALGASHWQTIYRVVLKGAASGIVAGVMLGIGRVIGETMAVMMITGNAAVMPHTLFQPMRTMTATIAAEMGETVQGSDHYFALFSIGLVLFVITFLINLIADFFLHRELRRS